MNDDTTPPWQPEPEPAPEAQPEPQPETPKSHAEFREAFDDLKRAAKRVWQEGSEETRQARTKAGESMFGALQGLVHDMAYGSGFASRVMREVFPDEVGDAAEKGRTKGEDAAAEFLRKRQEAKEARKEEATANQGPEDDGEVPPSEAPVFV